MKNLKIIIIVIISIIVVLCTFLFLFNNHQVKEKRNINVDLEVEENTPDGNLPQKIEGNFKKVELVDYYFTVKDIIGELFHVNYASKEEACEILRAILGKEYLEESSLTENQLIARYKKYAEDSFHINQMYVANKKENLDIYLVEIALLNNKTDAFMVVLNSYNLTFSIFPKEYIEKHNYTVDMNGDSILEFEIEDKEYNKFMYQSVKQEDIVTYYFNDYKYKLFYDMEQAYDVLDSDYKKERFDGKIEQYKNYVNNYQKQLKTIRLEKYLINTYTDGTEYICKDQYENYYIFYATAFMQYTLKLDNYTILTEDFKEAYQKADNLAKVKMNVERFVQMLNRYDYEAAYHLLDDTFKTNNFPNLEDFEKYIKSNYFQCNYINYGDCSKEASVYVCKILLAKDKETQEGNEMNIIMKLKEGTDFVMSFSVRTMEDES